MPAPLTTPGLFDERLCGRISQAQRWVGIDVYVGPGRPRNVVELCHLVLV
jgi:hypothetical protein